MPNECSHTADLKRFQAELDGFREVMEERDKRYQERFEGYGQQLQSAFDASQRALDKAESAQDRHNVAQNEWRAQNKDLLATFMPRLECEVKFQSMTDAINRREDQKTSYTEWIIGTAIVIAGIVVAAIMRFTH